MTLVALSAAYGAAGSRIGPALAEHLDVPFLDRAIPLAVAERLDLDVEHAAEFGQGSSASLLERMLRGFVGTDTGAPAPTPPELISDEDFRATTEQVLREHAADGEAVILGRGSVFVLRDDPRALRVRLTGPSELRVAQAMRMQGIDEGAARQAMRRVDRAHAEYAKRFYGVDIDDASGYHMVLDSTVLPVEVCVELIAAAAFHVAAHG
jgi:hypothetical protein